MSIFPIDSSCGSSRSDSDPASRDRIYTRPSVGSDLPTPGLRSLGPARNPARCLKQGAGSLTLYAGTSPLAFKFVTEPTQAGDGLVGLEAAGAHPRILRTSLRTRH
jgi:hypothetical protein